MRQNFVSPRGIRLFEDASLCLQMVTDMRAARGCVCPRCESKDVRYQRDRRRIHGYFACQNCNYDFNATAGTFFMGARLPITSYLQMLTLHNALEDSLSPFEACLAIGTNNRSVVDGILRRIRSINLVVRFTMIDRALAAQVRLHHHPETESEAERFFLYCETKSILVNEQALLAVLDTIANTRVPGLVESYKRRGQPRSPKPKFEKSELKRAEIAKAAAPLRGDESGEIGLKKDIAKGWIERLAEALPDISPRLRTRMAWQLASLGVYSDRMLAELEDGALKHASGFSSSLLVLRDQYLNGRGFDRF